MPLGTVRSVRRTAANVKPRRPRILTSLVANSAYREPQNNPAKIDLATKTLELARQQRIDLLALSAGYLTVTTRAEILPAVRPIINLAKKYGISVVVGVDLEEIKRFRSSDGARMLEAVALRKIPAFLAVYDANTGKTLIRRQRSCTSFQSRQRIVPDEVMTPKTIDICGSTVQIVFCGEVYDPRLFEETAPSTALIVAHTAMPRAGKTLRAKGRRGFGILSCEHRACRDGKHLCNDQGTDRSQSATLHIEGENGLWLEAATWEVNSKGRIRPAQPE